MKSILLEVLKGTAGGAIAGFFFLVIGVIRALAAMLSGSAVDWTSDAEMMIQYVGAIALVGAVGRPLWVLSDHRHAKLVASAAAGAVGGVLIFRLVESSDGASLPDVIGAAYGVLLGGAFWWGWQRRDPVDPKGDAP